MRRSAGHACLLVALALLLSITGCVTTYRETYPDGTLKKEGELYLGLQEGEWRYFYENGQLKARGHYTRDIPDGDWSYWYKNGQLEMQGSIVEERRSGPWTYWHPDGKLRAEGRFEDGLKAGRWVFHSHDGTLIREGEFERGKPTLLARFWHRGGAKKAEGWFFQGDKVGTWEYRDRQGRPFARSYTVPDGCRLLRETWEGGGPRRQGFLLDGEKTGRWITWHEGGERRIEGRFSRGSATGQWVAYDGDGEPLAAGEIQGGRLRGDWTVWIDGKPRSIRPDDFFRPPNISTGEWSPATIVEARSAEDVVRLWVAEASLPADSDHLADLVRPVRGPAPPESVERETAQRPRGLTRFQPEFTVREKNQTEKYIEYYTVGPTAGYGGPSIVGDYIPASAAERRQRQGNTSLSDPLLGRNLPVTILRTPDGGEIDLNDLRGQKVVLVILRGYAGQVCIYCATQVRAYSRAGAFETFQDREAAVIIVYPGSADHLAAFLEAYAASFGEKAPPYTMLYDEDLRLTRALNIVGNLAHPTTLILDEAGRIRFAYVGEDKTDRPAVARLTEELDKLGPASVP